ELLYQNPDFSDCYINNLPNYISNQAVSNYEIYPNPFNDDLVLNKKDQESDLVTTFELYNNMGVLLKKIKLQHQRFTLMFLLIQAVFIITACIQIIKIYKREY
ncbi:MAG: hypothetical protein R6U85_02665, partial [Salinivirgaceae bacterium]